MKKNIYLYLIIFQVFLLPGFINAQNAYSVIFNIQDPLPDNVMKTVALSGNEELTDDEIAILTPAAQMYLQPAGAEARLHIVVTWQDEAGEGFQTLYEGTTYPFTIQNSVYSIATLNDDLDMEYDDFNSDAFDEVRKRGKFTGLVNVTIDLLNAAGEKMDSHSQELSFLNPSQSLELLLPIQGSREYTGGILATWTELAGVDNYIVKANYRNNSSVSLEEALDSGTPILDNVEVTTNTVNLINLQNQREWEAGKEVVLQVSAESGAEVYRSEIVNFYLRGDIGSGDNTTSAILNLAAVLGEDLNNELLNTLLTGADLEITDITVNGQVVSYEELQQILNSLRDDPDRIIRIELINQ